MNVGGVGLYIRRLGNGKVFRGGSNAPKIAAKKAADHGVRFVQIMGGWQQPRKDGKVKVGTPNKADLRRFVDAFGEAGITCGLWFYPWAGYETEMLDALHEQCLLAPISHLSNDAELGYKWGKKAVAAEARRQAGTNMRGVQPEAIRDVDPPGSKDFVLDRAGRLAKGIDNLVAEFDMGFGGHWQTSYGVARFHPNFPWEVFAKSASVLSPQLYTATPEQVDLGIASWYELAGDPGKMKMMVPSVGTYGAKSNAKMHEHLSSFVDAEEGTDGFIAWSWMQTNSLEWDVLHRWSKWVDWGLCTLEP